MGRLRPNFIVGIGGSAGALNAYKSLLDAVPSKTGMAFVIISHMNPTASSELANILSRHTKMKVMVPAEGLPILRNHVYVIPPNADLFIENYTFKVVSPRARRNNQIDLFLSSIAEAMGEYAIGIILSGYDGDGSEGCKQIKAKRGTTFAQDDSAEIIHMPASAEATGCVDYVLSPEKIAKELLKISKNDK
jgi:two-component system CheB/CheR fusion protein